jgi:hypothetical protein
MTHDPICNNSSGPCCEWMGECDCQCTCDWIAAVRNDHTQRIVKELDGLKGKSICRCTECESWDRAINHAKNIISDIIERTEEDMSLKSRTDDIICYLNTPIASVELMGLLVGLEDCVIDTDDSENIVIRRK